jgi:alanine racemase
MSVNLKSLVSVLHAEWNGSDTVVFIEHISIDSRSLQNGSQTLFFALAGVNNDAHSYISELIGKGVQNFVVEYIPENC